MGGRTRSAGSPPSGRASIPEPFDRPAGAVRAAEGRDDDLAGMVAGLTRLVVVGIAVVVLLFATLGFLVS